MKRPAILVLLALAACEKSPSVVPNRAPVAGDPIPDIEMFVGEEQLVDISFHDPDGDMLVVTSSTSDPGVALALVFGVSAVKVLGVGPGSATVGLTAKDPEGLWAQLSFRVTVFEPGSGGGGHDP